MKGKIVIRGARQNNLKGIDLDLPRRALVLVTGPSGSGKSSLAFDTVYAEGQRRYVESLSTYAKQFLERVEKPDVDRVDGVSPAVAIEQKNRTKTSRSTVGTATEVYDYLRLLWARVGRTFCPECGREVRPDTPGGAADRVLALPDETRVSVCFPLPRSAQASHGVLVDNLRALGFARVVADGRPLHLDFLEQGADLTRAGELLVAVDRLCARAADRVRLAEAVEVAFSEGEGEAVVLTEKGDRLRFTESFSCAHHPGAPFATPTPQLFSFNSPYGSCPLCTGFGAVLEYDQSLLIPHAERSLQEGAVDPWSKPRYKVRRQKLYQLAARHGVPVTAPWSRLPQEFREMVLHGGEGFQGVLPFLSALEKKRYKQYIRVFLRQYQSARSCPACGGRRLRPEALRVKVAGKTISEVAARAVSDTRLWVEELAGLAAGGGGKEGGLSGFDREVAGSILRELCSRLSFLDQVGVGYLTLDRQTRTLSGGEAQRISLSNAVGSKLVDTLYVLDEPTVGLHPADNDRLLRLLERLREGGNSVLLVEHDQAAIRRADWVVELGPGSGERGGGVVFQGTVDELLAADTLTGRYLAGKQEVAVPERRQTGRGWLRLEGAREHNLRGIDVDIPLCALTVVSGVSGSGKSTLVHDVLYRALERELSGETSAKRHLGEPVGEYRSLSGAGGVRGVVLVDQSPIGRTPRSNPVTYVKAYDEVRRVFVSLPEASKRGYAPRHFSFNVKGGRCEACAGGGQVRVEMVFMADVFVPCEVCKGARFRPEILEVTYRGKNIHQVLELTVDEAIRFFLHEDRLGEALWHLQQVGLGYLRLGQPAPTLSGGEAQRIKIARELASVARSGGKKVYILDEPTTGLHLDDVAKLLRVLNTLVKRGHTVVVIEHNLDVIKSADWVIDLGPGAGPKGGVVVAMGTPEEVAAREGSVTGQWLAPMLGTPAPV
ncbi:MAG: excinuclease ABC subunit UvrA [Longimicrobiaceae bacterium]